MQCGMPVTEVCKSTQQLLNQMGVVNVTLSTCESICTPGWQIKPDEVFDNKSATQTREKEKDMLPPNQKKFGNATNPEIGCEGKNKIEQCEKNIDEELNSKDIPRKKNYQNNSSIKENVTSLNTGTSNCHILLLLEKVLAIAVPTSN